MHAMHNTSVFNMYKIIGHIKMKSKNKNVTKDQMMQVRQQK